MSHSLETRYEIWNDHCGSRIEVGPDHDSLGLVQIRHIDAEGKEILGTRGVFTEAQATLLIVALTRVLEDFRRERIGVTPPPHDVPKGSQSGG